MSTESPTVFISYSHRDEAWKDRLVRHLRVLELEGEIDLWDDRRIAAGEDWQESIERAIDRARIAILLISADFLTSRFIREQEVTRILNRRETEGLHVIPLILQPCPWQAIGWLSEIQARPLDGQPLSAHSDHEAEHALSELALEVRKLLLRETQHAVSSSRPDRGPAPLPRDPGKPRTLPVRKLIAALCVSLLLVAAGYLGLKWIPEDGVATSAAPVPTRGPWEPGPSRKVRVEVVRDAAYSGNYGMRISGFGDEPGYVVDDSPNLERFYRASFYLRLNALSFGPTDELEVFSAYDAADRPQFQLRVRRAGESKRIRVVAFQDDGSSVEGSDAWFRDGYRQVEVVWRAASTHNSLDGFGRLTIDGVAVSECASLDNTGGRVDKVRLGAIQGLGASTSGQIDFDEFAWWRTPLTGSEPSRMRIPGE